MRRAALELLISLSEARPSMVKKCNGWVNGVVRCCLEGMAEIRDEGGEATLRWSNTDDVSEIDSLLHYPNYFLFGFCSRLKTTTITVIPMYLKKAWIV